MMPFLLAESDNAEKLLPLYVSCVGSHEQKYLERPDGYPAHQLFLSRSGRGIFRIEGRRDLAMTPGTALIVPTGVAHEYFPDETSDVWDLGFVAFRGSLAAPLLEQLNAYLLNVRPVRNFDDLWNQLESLWHLLGLNGENACWEASRRIYHLAVSLLEGQADRKPGKRVYPFEHPNEALQAAVQLIHDHYNERLPLAQVAGAAGYSVQHFHRLFVAGYGETPQQYIIRLRMRRSVQLFEDHPGITVGKVAGQLGMETSYFIRMFKRVYGYTPKQYAKKYPIDRET